jgi:hypothetical protein
MVTKWSVRNQALLEVFWKEDIQIGNDIHSRIAG